METSMQKGSMAKKQQREQVVGNNCLAEFLEQLKNWKVNYHELIMCKPSYDIFIDDKNLGFRKDWHNLLIKKLR